MEKDYKTLKLEQIELLNNLKSSAKLKLRNKFKGMEWFFSFDDNLPNNWIDVNILDVTWLVTCGVAKKPNYIEKGIPFLSAQNARPFKANLNKIKYISQEQFETLTVGGKPKKNDILYTRVGNCGEAAKVPFEFDFAVYVSLTLIKPIHELIDSDYLVAFLNSHYGLTQANKGAIGIGLKNLNVNNVRRYRIPLPPLKEQQRIVAKLDKVFTHLDSLKTRLENIPQLLKNFRQAILTQAVTGKLTQEWRKGKELEEWKEKTITEIAKPLSGFAFKSKDFVETGFQLIRMGNLYKNKLDISRNPVYLPINFDEKIINKYSVKKNDILLSLTGTKYKKDYGYAIKVESEEVLLLNQRILSLTPKINPDYLLYLLRDNIFRNQFFKFETGGVNQGNVGVKNVLTIKLPIPPKEEQIEIVKRVENLFAKADKIEAKYQNLNTKTDSLPQAILAKAFKGELVPQLPTDGDAKDLLAEIQKLKEASLSSKPSLRGTKQSVKRKRKVKS